MSSNERSGALPRELADGVFWLGECLEQNYRATPLHSYNSVFLVAGEEASLLVEAGHPQDLLAIETQLDGLLEDGAPPLRYVFTTHTETPHSAGVGRLLQRYPEAVACGDVEDLDLVFPEVADRLVPLDPGDRLDLGGRTFLVVESIFRDFAYTRWGYDDVSGTLFAGDGFAYSHYHEAGHCGKLAEEVPELDLPDMTAVFADLAFYWTRFVDLDPYIARLDDMLRRELDVRIVAPTHGLPFTDLDATLPKIYEGLRIGGELRAAAQRTSASPSPGRKGGDG